jgi:hypothetical protein
VTGCQVIIALRPCGCRGRRRLSGWRFETGLAAGAVKGLSSVGFTHPQGSYCELTNRWAKPPMQDPWGPGDGERRGALMTEAHLRRRGDSFSRSSRAHELKKLELIQSGTTLSVRISKQLEMLFGQIDEVVTVDWGDEDWVNRGDSSSFASPVPGFSLPASRHFLPTLTISSSQRLAEETILNLPRACRTISVPHYSLIIAASSPHLASGAVRKEVDSTRCPMRSHLLRRSSKSSVKSSTFPLQLRS